MDPLGYKLLEGTASCLPSPAAREGLDGFPPTAFQNMSMGMSRCPAHPLDICRYPYSHKQAHCAESGNKREQGQGPPLLTFMYMTQLPGALDLSVLCISVPLLGWLTTNSCTGKRRLLCLREGRSFPLIRICGVDPPCGRPFPGGLCLWPCQFRPNAAASWQFLDPGRVWAGADRLLYCL